MSVPQAAKTFGGVIVPMGSPFTTDGRTDRDAVHRIVKHLVTGGVHGVFIMGTMGEGPFDSAGGAAWRLFQQPPRHSTLKSNTPRSTSTFRGFA